MDNNFIQFFYVILFPYILYELLIIGTVCFYIVANLIFPCVTSREALSSSACGFKGIAADNGEVVHSFLYALL